MSSEGRILTNAVILATGEGIGQVANFAFVVLLARRYGTELFGQYSLAMAVGAMACILVSLGVHDVLTRDIGHEPDEGQVTFGKWVPAEFGSALIVWMVIVLCTAWYEVDHTLRVILIAIGGYQIALHLAGLFYLQFAARGRMLEPSVVDALHRVIVFAAAASAMWLQAPATVVLWLLPAIAGIEVVIAAWQGRRAFGAVRSHFDPKAIAGLIRQGGRFLVRGILGSPPHRQELVDLVKRGRPFLALGLLSVVQIRAGVILLAILSGSISTGVYAAADRVMLPIIMVQDLVVRAAYPAMLRLWITDRDQLFVVATNCLKIMFLAAIPLSGMIFVFRRDLISIVFGEQFAASAAPLAVLAWMPIAVGAIFLFSAQAIASNLDKEAAKIHAVVVGPLIFASIVLIYFFGAIGLCIGVVSAASLHAIFLFLLLARGNMATEMPWIIVKPTTAVAVGIAAHFFVAKYGLVSRLAIVTAAIMLSLWLLGSIRMDELRATTAALQGKLEAEDT